MIRSASFLTSLSADRSALMPSIKRRRAPRERMGPSRLAEAPHQRLVGSIKEQHFDRTAA